MNIVPGIYQHYKGKYYMVIGTATDSESLLPMVLYMPLYNDEKTFWVRPLSMFTEHIEVNGQKMQRFRMV